MYIYESELMHHGIKGMHWGIRRFQSYEVTGKRKGGKGGRETGDAAKQKFSKVKKERRKWKDLSDEEKASIKRRIALGAAGVAVAALAGSAAVKIGREQLGYSVRSKTFERVTNSATADTQHRIYATIGKADRKAYSGMLAAQMKQGMYGNKAGTDVYRHTLERTGKIKIAGNVQAKKAFNELKKNDAFFQQEVGNMSYKQYNKALANHSKAANEVHEKFYNALKKKGYAGVHDMNDRRFFGKDSVSGYDSKKATILFNTSKLKAKKAEKLSNEEISKNLKKWQHSQMARKTVGGIVKSPIGVAAGIGAAGALGSAAVEEHEYQKSKKKGRKTK